MDNPITYRMIYKCVDGTDFSDAAWVLFKVNPDDVVKCNCNWAEGHEPWCDMVKANELIRRKKHENT